MTSPNQYLIRMLVFLVAVSVVVFLLFAALERAFDANPLLNALILAVLVIGILWNLRAAQRLGREVTWVETFQQARQRLAGLPQPRLLAPMARMLHSRADSLRDDRFTLSAPAQRALLDSVASRLDEQRELSRYMVGLLIFLGLLGTFWGLLLTVSSISQVIAGMSVGSGDVNALFEQLKSGLAKPLQGMGTAFSSSMLGLSSALVLGFLDLTAGQAQNRFFNELEEWLAGLTHLGSGLLGGDADGSVPVYVQALLEQTAENMQQLQSILARGEDGRRESNHAVLMLSERLGTLTDMMHRNEEDASRGHLRNIDLHLQRLISDLDAGRTQSTQEIRNEIKILAKTIASVADDRRG
jgi:hypothetical protein